MVSIFFKYIEVIKFDHLPGKDHHYYQLFHHISGLEHFIATEYMFLIDKIVIFSKVPKI